MNTEDDEFQRIEREQAMGVPLPAKIYDYEAAYLALKAQRALAIPDAIHHVDTSESLEYITGWNDCRQAMLAALPAQPEHDDPIGEAQDKLIAEQALLNEIERELVGEQPAQQEPFCYHDGRSIVGKEYADHSDVFPLYAEPPVRRSLGTEQKPVAWMVDGSLYASKEVAQKMGGNSYTLQALYTSPQPAQPAQQQEPVAVPTTSYEHRKFVLAGRQWYERFAAFHDDCQIGEQLTWQEKTSRLQGYENGWNDAQRHLKELQATSPATSTAHMGWADGATGHRLF